MPSKSKETELKLKELDKLLEQKKISAEEYLDLKTKLELETKTAAVKEAKQATKPKVLNFVCPNCGSPQKNVAAGVGEFNCEMCGKRVKVFDATQEAQKLLAKMPEMMEAVALERLFIEPQKFKIEAGLQKEIAFKHVQGKLDSLMLEAEPLNECFSRLFDAHGFQFLELTEGMNTKAVPWAKVKDTSRPLVIVPVDKENQFDEQFRVLLPEQQLDIFTKLDIRDDLGVSEAVRGMKNLLSKSPSTATPVTKFAWNDSKKLNAGAEQCLAVVKPFNEIANNFAVLAAYAEPGLKLHYFLPVQMRASKMERELESTATEDENLEALEEAKKVFSSFSPICWANFFRGLASHFQGYGRLLLLQKERLEKNQSFPTRETEEIIRNFEDASEAFERAAQNADEKRQHFLKFYAHVSNGFAKALKGELKENETKKLEEERAVLTDVEERIIGANEGSAWDYTERGYFAGDIYKKFFLGAGKSWKNQRIKGLARTFEGPRYLFFLEMLFAKELVLARRGAT